MKNLVIVSLLALSFALSASAKEKAKSATSTPDIKPASTEVMGEAQRTYADIRKTLGSVPTFLKRVPVESIPGVWDQLKNVQLSMDTALPHKYKELIGLAVASQIPCKYCVYFHTESAKKFSNASEREINEGVAVAAESRQWSTYFNSGAVDFNAFKGETDQIFENMKKQAQQQAGTAGDSAAATTTSATDTTGKTGAQWAYQDMQKTLGFTPNFIKAYPESGVAGAWRSLKGLHFSETAIPSKYKNLIALAVASQTPCQFCTYFDRKSLTMDGASDKEIGEAIAMASIVRYLSTVLNGSGQDEKQFRTEVASMFKYVKAQSAKQQKLGKSTTTSEQAGEAGSEEGYPVEP